MSRIYEAMFLIDNDRVRAGWQATKAAVTGLVEKHGGQVKTSRRWAERRLAYPIRRRNRATYLLTYLDLEPGSIPALNRDLEINDMVLRHLFLRTAAVPAAEIELSAAESAADFIVPEPPPDDAVDEPERREHHDEDLDIEDIDDDADLEAAIEGGRRERPPIRRVEPAIVAATPERTEG
ncbi:MAG: 30S ribosomal protein S6 [Planctomycetota bacterium]